MQHDIILSIIVPVYNVEKFLSECLDSVLKQDIPKERYEIICVNDGSKDSCGEILDSYSKKYDNIVIVNQENQGPSSARNSGIKVARGKYIWFIDSDDKIHTNILSCLLGGIKDNDVLFLSFVNIPEDDFGLKEESFTPKFSYNLPISDAYCKSYKMLNNDYNFRSFSCGMIIRTSLLKDNNLLFPAGMRSQEDTVFLFLLHKYLKKISYVNAPVYYYRMRNNSLSHDRSEKQCRDMYFSLRIMLDVYENELENHASEYSKELMTNLNLRTIMCKESIIFSLLATDKDFFYDELRKLKYLNIYPYPFRRDNLMLHKYPSIKYKIIALSKFLLPCELYLKFFRFIMSLRK